MYKNILPYESQRLLVQSEFESVKKQSDRNRLGQFATPTELARDILGYARKLFSSDEQIIFLDPAFGTGAFYSAFLQYFERSQIAEVHGYEIDQTIYSYAQSIWHTTNLNLSNSDFTLQKPPVNNENKANLIICNPPYVRHHHLTKKEKNRLGGLVKLITGRQLSGLSGLYCYFLCLCHAWMRPDAIAGWLIPSEFMDVNYGREIKTYLTHEVSLLHIHRFNPNEVQFSDALVSSVIVWFKNTRPDKGHIVQFSYGGSLTEPTQSMAMTIDNLRKKDKWSSITEASTINISKNSLHLSELFVINRGIATGANKFFILSQEEIAKYDLPSQMFVPILPSARYLESDEIFSDEQGIPKIEKRYFLLKCHMPESQIKEIYPKLWDYLQKGIEEGINKKYIASHRSPWYSQEERTASQFLCTYIGREMNGSRKNPFRFILNQSNAICTNVYLMMYPKPNLARAIKNDPSFTRQIWVALKSIQPQILMRGGRVYGGGMYKLEPKELLNIPIELPQNIIVLFQNIQQELILDETT
ncbi:MAG: Eco57I restriction-modification methylase domain-containing protein [Bacteroidota bacterium]